MPGINDFCFVIGAGAHAQYNFPLGNQLRRLIIDFPMRPATRRSEKLKKVVIDSDTSFCLDNFLRSYSQEISSFDKSLNLGGTLNNAEIYNEFSVNFANSGYASIDAFLANTPKEEYKIVGKLILSYLMISFESNINFEKIELGWIQYLLNTFAPDRARFIDFLSKGPKFLTFNYDTFLERVFLERGLSVGLDIEEAKRLSELNIHHVYGKTNYTSNLYDNHQDANKESFKTSLTSLKVIGEDRENSSFRLPESFLFSNKLIFLGFYYDVQNMSLLSEAGLIHPNRKNFGTTYGLLEPEVSVLKNSFFSEAQFDNYNDTADVIVRKLIMDLV